MYFVTMEMGYYAVRSLIPTLMAWVQQSRLQKSLPKHECDFITSLGEAYVQINLSHLDREYITKHIEPDMQKYCDTFTQHLKPILRAWCIKCNMQEAKVSLRFKAHYIVDSCIIVSVTRQELDASKT
jgi:hypothetical protein